MTREGWLMLHAASRGCIAVLSNSHQADWDEEAQEVMLNVFAVPGGVAL